MTSAWKPASALLAMAYEPRLAVGLIAAIPAYIAYNKFSTDASRYTARLEELRGDQPPAAP